MSNWGKILSATLDLVRFGVVLTDADGGIVHANRAARALLTGGAVHRASGKLRALDAQSSSGLRQAISSAASGTTAHIPKSGLSMVVKGGDSPDLAIWVLPLDVEVCRDLRASPDASVAVFIRQLGDTSMFPAEIFVQTYGITPTECRLLTLLTQGQTLKNAAATLGTSVATSRTHVARLLAKTGTHSQADLMRLAISALAPASIES